MTRTLRNMKYIFLQTQAIFALAVGLGIFILALFEFFLSPGHSFHLGSLIASVAFNVPILGILMLALTLGSYYQLLCPFYLSFSTTRKQLYLSMKVMAWLPVLELLLLSLILLLFVDKSVKPTIIGSYKGLMGIALIGLSFGEFMGTISLKFTKFGRIFPALLGGIGGGIGGFFSSYFADATRPRSITFATALNKYGYIFLIIGLLLYLITNIVVCRIIKKLSAY